MKKLINNFFSCLKYRYIVCLDRDKKYCWARLVMWQLEYEPFWSLFIDNSYYKTQTCRPEKGRPGYCGKCDKYFLERNKK